MKKIKSGKHDTCETCKHRVGTACIKYTTTVGYQDWCYRIQER